MPWKQLVVVDLYTSYALWTMKEMWGETLPSHSEYSETNQIVWPSQKGQSTNNSLGSIYSITSCCTPLYLVSDPGIDHCGLVCSGRSRCSMMKIPQGRKQIAMLHIVRDCVALHKEQSWTSSKNVDFFLFQTRIKIVAIFARWQICPDWVLNFRLRYKMSPKGTQETSKAGVDAGGLKSKDSLFLPTGPKCCTGTYRPILRQALFGHGLFSGKPRAGIVSYGWYYVSWCRCQVPHLYAECTSWLICISLGNIFVYIYN